MSLRQSEVFSKSILDQEKCPALNASIVILGLKVQTDAIIRPEKLKKKKKKIIF